jgi:hypothetical protein
MRWSLQARHPAPDLFFSFNKADEILSAIFKNKKKCRLMRRLLVKIPAIEDL